MCVVGEEKLKRDINDAGWEHVTSTLPVSLRSRETWFSPASWVGLARLGTTVSSDGAQQITPYSSHSSCLTATLMPLVPLYPLYLYLCRSLFICMCVCINNKLLIENPLQFSLLVNLNLS